MERRCQEQLVDCRAHSGCIGAQNEVALVGRHPGVNPSVVPRRAVHRVVPCAVHLVEALSPSHCKQCGGGVPRRAVVSGARVVNVRCATRVGHRGVIGHTPTRTDGCTDLPAEEDNRHCRRPSCQGECRRWSNAVVPKVVLRRGQSRLPGCRRRVSPAHPRKPSHLGCHELFPAERRRGVGRGPQQCLQVGGEANRRDPDRAIGRSRQRSAVHVNCVGSL
mmetsp:Transcript_3095/g.7412  ORF Transcript_3095/g.7412 Transcript_3095/m.7412 type:complete len:220 (-) Transcript_3095:368-1027(-)